jgi:ABC-type lipoprotein release transport system permease subunit
MKGILVGWDHQARSDMKNWEIGGGQYWHEAYDPYDPFTLTLAHAPIPASLASGIDQGEIEPVLITQGTIYPSGRMQSILIKGIDPGQQFLSLPSHKLDTAISDIPAIIGTRMASNNKLKVGDYIVIRWRDAHGTFDAAEICIAGIFKTNVPTVDVAQIWMPIEKLRSMLLLPGEATLLTFRDYEKDRGKLNGWKLMTHESLFSDIEKMIKTKSSGQMVFYIILLLLAMLAVFDTQVLSIFRRQKEIGTYIALGYTRTEVVGLFTLEGAMHAVLAAVLATMYGIPFLFWQSMTGITLPVDSGDYGIAIADTMYPVYSAGLVIATICIVLITTTVVSYLPSRRIAKMNPTEALRGKLQ